MELDLGLRKTYIHIFIVTDVGYAILGAYFLQNFGLLVDLHGQCSRDQETYLEASGVVKFGTSLHPAVANEESIISKLIEEYPW